MGTFALTSTPWAVECPKRPIKRRFLFFTWSAYLPHNPPKMAVGKWDFGLYEINGTCMSCKTPIRRFGISRAEMIAAGFEAEVDAIDKE